MYISYLPNLLNIERALQLVQMLNMMSNLKVHFYETNLTNMMSNFKAHFYNNYKSYFYGQVCTCDVYE